MKNHNETNKGNAHPTGIMLSLLLSYTCDLRVGRKANCQMAALQRRTNVLKLGTIRNTKAKEETRVSKCNR